VVPGEDVTISGSGFAAGTPYTITFHSTPQLLARGTTPQSGTITRTVKVPSNATPGHHTIVLLGTDASGGPRELDVAVTVVGNIGSTQTQGGGTGGLPGTGADGNLMPLLGVGGGLVLVGAGFVGVSRKRRSSAHTS
jgi:LPXTG-motif cell wall-anchored protein